MYRRSSKISTAFPIAAQYAARAAQQEERQHTARAGRYQLDAVYLDVPGRLRGCQYILCEIHKEADGTDHLHGKKTVYSFKRNLLGNLCRNPKKNKKDDLPL